MEAIKQALQLLEGAKESIGIVLKDSPNHKIFADLQLQKIINYFAVMSGSSSATQAPQTFEPVKSFMGEVIEEVIIKPEDLKPTPTQAELFKQKVQELYNELPTMDLTNILVGEALDRTVLRGVAKLAGIENYKEADITQEFVELVKAKVIEKLDGENAVNEAKTAKTVSDEPEPEPEPEPEKKSAKSKKTEKSEEE